MDRTDEAGEAPSRRLVLVGASFRTADPALRERLFLDDVAASRLSETLAGSGIREILVLPTCDRLDLYLGLDGDDDGAAALPAMADVLGVEEAELRAQSYRLEGSEAENQLFAVAAALDSAVPGEPQILGQLKDAHRRARDVGTVGALLEPLLQAAYGCAKRVASDTALGRHPVSMVAAARNVAQRLHGNLANAAAFLIGLGDMGLLVASSLKDAGLRRIVATHPNEARALSLARDMGFQYRPWEERDAALADADVAIAAMGVGRIAVTRPMVEAALTQRRRRPILLIDTAIPGDIDEAAGQSADAFLYTLDDLDRLAQDGLTNRQEAAETARAIVDEAAAAYRRDRAARDMAPTLSLLRERFEAVRAEILETHADDAAEATRRMLNRLLHDPARALRDLAGTPAAADADHWLARLFAPSKERKDRS